MRRKKERKKDEVIENIMENNSMKLFTMLSGYFLSVLILFSLLQFINHINLNIIQIISVITPIIIYLIKNQILSNKKKIITILIYIFMILILPFIYNKTYDLSVDGNSYHKTAIAFLKNGWNPLYESARQFQKHNDKVIPIEKKNKQDLWIEHYPKATWIIAATIYSMTDNIESGKCITFILSVMLLIISYNCLKKILDKKWVYIIAIMIVLNPIVLSQIFTYYVDGIMGICFTIELLLLMNINPKEKINKNILVGLVSICSIFVNLKFTGLVCSGTIAAVYYFYWLISNRKINLFEVFKKTTIMFAIVFVSAIFIVGSNSYIQNTYQHHNPLYPLMGKEKVDIITRMEPKNFKNKSKFEKYIISTFSKTENISGDGYAKTKNPLKIYQEEITNLYLPDLRMAGFGPLTALITIFSVILLIILSIILYKKERKNILYILLPLSTIIITSLLVGEYWWARYVPQLHLIPISIFVLIVYLSKYIKKWYIPASAFLLVIAVNTACFIYIDVEMLLCYRTITNDIKKMRQVENLKLKLACTNDQYGYYYTLNDNHVKYIVDEDIQNEEMLYKYSWRIGVEKRDELY